MGGSKGADPKGERLRKENLQFWPESMETLIKCAANSENEKRNWPKMLILRTILTKIET